VGGALRGAAALGFGLLCVVMPGLSLAALVLLFGVYALVDGVLDVVAAVRGTAGDRPWWSLVLGGAVSIAAGGIALALPGLTALLLLYVIAAWAVLTGALKIAAAVRLRRHITGEWRLVLGGLVSVALGVVLALFPGAGALALVLWLGAFALVFGVLLLALALRLRRGPAERPGSIARAA
jgi:uncharacterized membrane protein HdeD (DUF308 family)